MKTLSSSSTVSSDGWVLMASPDARATETQWRLNHPVGCCARHPRQLRELDLDSVQEYRSAGCVRLRIARYKKGMRKRGGLVRLRVGFVIGFGAGYYFGSKAGRLRYEQIQRWLAEARQSGPVEKVQAAVEARLERMRQQTEALTGTAIAPDASS